MKIKTRKFGEIDISKEKILQMPYGLPGFPGKNRFVLLERKETRPFCWFQCVDDPDLVLVVMNPLIFMPDYRVNLKPMLNELGWERNTLADMAVYVVVTIHESGAYRMTANLIGPIVMNTKKCEAVQLVIHDSSYSHQHPIMKFPENHPPVERRAASA